MVDNPVLTSPERIKKLFPGFASNNQSHQVWALQFLMELWEVLFADSALKGLKSGRKILVWFDQEPNPIVLKTINELRTTDSSRDRLLMYPSDVVQLMVGLANALKIPNKGLDYFFSNALTDGEIREHSVLDTQTITELERLYGEIRLKLNRLNKPPGAEKESTEEEIAEVEEPTKAAEAPTSAVSTTKVGPVPDAGGEGVGAEEPSETATDQPGTTSPFHNESFIKAVRKRNENREFAWIYNHTVFDLLGRHGIVADQATLSTISAEVHAYLGALSDQQLADLFANPVGRMGAVTNIYRRLSARTNFVSNLRAQVEQHLATLPESERQAFISLTGFDTTQTNEGQFTQQLAQAPDFASKDPIVEIEKSLAQLIGTKKIDGSVAINFEQSARALVSLASSEEELFRLIDQLSPESLTITLFPNPNNPNVPDPSMLEKIKQNITIIRSLLKNSLKVALVDKIANNPPNPSQEQGLSGVLLDDALDDEETTSVSSTVTAVRSLAGALPLGKTRDATEDALTTDAPTSHTQLLMEQYQKRVQKIWLQLDLDTQVRAYMQLNNMLDTNENFVVAQDRFKNLISAEDGKLPWNAGLFSIIDWEKFLRKNNKDQLLREQQLTRAEEKELKDKETKVQQTDSERSKAATGFLTGLNGQQQEQLQYSLLLDQLLDGEAYVQSVLDRLQSGSEVSELEYRSVLATIERINTRIALLSNLPSTEADKKFLESYSQEISALAVRTQELAARSETWRPTEEYAQTPDYSQLTLMQTHELTLTVSAPIILLPSVAEIEQLVDNPYQPMVDGVTAESILPQPESASLATLHRAAERNNSLTPNRVDQINATSQSNQAVNDLKNVVSGVGEIATQSKGNWVAAAGLGIKKYFTDREFRKSINRTLMKIAQIAMGGFIAGGALVGLLLQKLVGAVGAWGGAAAGAAAGGAIGFAFGGPFGALVGAGIGGYLGYSAGAKAAALNAASGAELLPPGMTSSTGFEGVTSSSGLGETTTITSPVSSMGTSSTPGSPLATTTPSATASPSVSQSAFQTNVLNSTTPSTSGVSSVGAQGSQYGSSVSAAAGEAGMPGATTASSGAATAAASQAPFLGVLAGLPILALIPGMSMLILAMITMYTMFVIFSAFLIPLPVGNLTGTNSTRSEYAVLTKLAAPSSMQNNSTTDVIYKIVLQPKRNYQLKVTAMTDTANTGFSFQSNRSDHTDPQVSPPSTLLNPRISLSDFSPDFDGQTQEVEYTVTFSGGKNVLVNNLVTISFDVQDAQGNTIASGVTMEATASVAIGDHGVQCWPTSGEITQLPGGSFSHDNSDAIDVAAPLGNNVYTPFDGWVQKGDMGRVDYGKFVVVDSFVQGRWIRMIYGHLMSTAAGTPVGNFWDNLAINHDNFGPDNGASNNVGQYVGAGQLIGRVDSTGRSTGNHLHYELGYINNARHRLGGPLTIMDLVPRKPTGGSYRNGDDVTTCFPIR